MTKRTDLPKGYHKNGMFAAFAEDGKWMALVNQANVDEDGVWVWFGFIIRGTLRPIEVGDVFPGLFVGSHTITATVIKLNRVTIKVADDEGNTYTVRVDR